MADIDNKEQSELDQDLDDVEEVEEQTGEEKKSKHGSWLFKWCKILRFLQPFEKDLTIW